jgi:heme exporter protein D
MPVDELKTLKDRYKILNDLEHEKNREQKIAKEALDENGQNQVDAMRETLPFLDRG